MKNLQRLLDNNKAWAQGIQASDPEFFHRLSKLQSPEYLWIGCSDSRVPANQIIGLLPGEIFVHRNIANVVVHTDLNCLSVIQFAVDILKVKHIIVCGHYGCGGVQAALTNQKLGLVNNWIRHVQDVWQRHKHACELLDEPRRWDTLCELNVISQVLNVAQTSILNEAWERGQEVTVHGWIYGLKDGLIQNLHIDISSSQDITPKHTHALSLLGL